MVAMFLCLMSIVKDFNFFVTTILLTGDCRTNAIICGY